MQNRIKPLLIIFFVILPLACAEPLACADEKQKEEESNLEQRDWDNEYKAYKQRAIQSQKDFARVVEELAPLNFIMSVEEEQKYQKELEHYRECVANIRDIASCETDQCTERKFGKLTGDCINIAASSAECERRCEIHYEACSFDVSNKLAKMTDCLDQIEACQYTCFKTLLKRYFKPKKAK